MKIQLKRVYEKPEKKDGFRVLVDRLWPRGLSKEKAHVDLWLKEIAPSNTLRKWFAHDPKKWVDFQRRYSLELQKNEQAIVAFNGIIREHKKITLLFAASDKDHNNAVALISILQL